MSALTTTLYLPAPLIQLLRRLFVVFSSISISSKRPISSSSSQGSIGDAPSPTFAVSPPDISPKEWSIISSLLSLPSFDLRGTLRWPSFMSSPKSSHIEPTEEKPFYEEKTRPPQPPKNESFPSPSPRKEPPRPVGSIHDLLSLPTLFDPIRKPRNPIVLCHGLYGFDVWGPSSFPRLQMHYWSNVLEVLRGKVGAEVVVTGVPGTGSVADRAQRMHKFLDEKVPHRPINFLAHSMGGLDCRYLITHIQPKSYNPLSLTTISTPHRGSPFMDWCKANIGIGALREALHDKAVADAKKNSTPPLIPYSLKSPLFSPPAVTPAPTSENILSGLPSSLTTLLLSLLDSPAYANLTTTFLNDHFNPSTPDVPGVRYFSVAARTERMSPFHPLWLPKLILDETDAIEKSQKGITEFAEEERGNDGLVSVRSAKWGEFLGIIEGCDHWEMRGARGFGSSWDAFGSKGGWGWSEYLGRNKDRGDEGRLKLDTVSSGTQEASAIPQVSKPESGSSSSPSTLERLRLTAAVDWITDHVPIALGTGSPVKETSGETVRKRRDVETSMKFDLERFYVALSRKLYDEGL